MVLADEFLEYNETYSSHSYGTPIQGILDVLKRRSIPCLEIDCVGLEKILIEGKIEPNSIISVFITTPVYELYKRLCERGAETREQIKNRLLTALQEASHVYCYQNVIINSDLNIAVAELQEAFEGRLQTAVEFDDVQLRKDFSTSLIPCFEVI